MGVTLAPTTANVEVGKTTKLTATVAPADATNQTVTYESSDATIATVSADGTVTGVKVGTVTITAMIDGKAATTTITVTESTEG